ncbi:MAG: tRNA pseudouridine(13) synthase TruD [bacterium]|nr:tRNA pseudouridine(13) synthase TruD [bacterium]
MTYKIKHIPEDFIVDEVSSVKPGKTGRFTYFTLRKKDFTTENAIHLLSNYLKIERKKFGYAGSKDRHAITSQVVSVLGRINSVKLKEISIETLGFGDIPISLGDLEGNKFTIRIRNIEKKTKRIDKITNYFDSQRFSSNNDRIGKEIICNDFKKAVEIVLKGNGKTEEIVANYLKEHPTDYIGALRTIPKKILMLYIHAIQSRIWNETARHFENRNKNMELPIVGFATEFNNKEIEETVNKILKKEGLTMRSFIVKSIPELSSEGGQRFLFADIKDLKIGELEDDDLNKGKKQCTVSFFLPRGSYATVVVKELFR